MFQVRIHGRGGQGAVTAAEMLSVAAFAEGSHALAFPTFGSERTGAPVVSFCRIDDAPIRSREPIAEPDALIVQDPTLLHQVDVFGGLGAEGRVLINSARQPEQLGLADLIERLGAGRLLTVPATDIAREHLGRPLPNAVLLGAFAAFADVVSIESVATAIKQRFDGPIGDRNVAGARAACEYVRDRMEGRVVA
jgi:pyruvate ferredoxin oxidoreductase gamma subunit